MLKKIFFLLSLILVLSNAFALDPKIIDFNNTEMIYGNEVIFNVGIDANGTSGTLNMWDGETIIEQKNYLISDNQMQFKKIFTQIGERTIKFTLTDPNEIDENNLNNSIEKTLFVQKGIDLTISSMKIIPNIYLPETNIKVEAFIENIGDKNLVDSVNAVLYYEGQEVDSSNLDTGLNVGEIKSIDFNYVLPSDFNGEKLIMAQINRSGEIKEFDITNNTITETISETGVPDLIIKGFVYEGEPTKGKGTKFIANIENTGGTEEKDVTVKVFKDAISESSKIYETTINLIGPYSIQQIDFTFFFTEDKEETFIVYVDPSNNIDESSENNNDYVLQFDVLDSNTEMDITDYLSNLSIVQAQLEDCKNEVYPLQLEKENALESVSNLTKERDSCQSNLNICNTNNATTLSNWVEGAEKKMEMRQESLDSNFIALQNFYYSDLSEKTDEWSRKEDEYKELIKIEKQNTNFAITAFFVLIIIIIGSKIFDMKNKQTARKVI